MGGLVLFEYLLSFIFGTYSYVAFQIINAIAAGLSFYLLAAIGKEMFDSDKNMILTAVLQALFLPAVLYNTFVYGNVVGFTFTLGALFFLLRFFQSGKIKWSILSAVCMMLSILIKSNYLIFLIAAVIFLFYGGIVEKKWKKNAIALVLMVGLYLAGNFIVNTCVTNLTGVQSTDGVPKIGYLVIGMTDSPNKTEGWYDNYNLDVYTQENYDSVRTEEHIKEDLTSIYKDYAAHPEKLLPFLTNKTLSQWNNPTFQGFWLYENRDSKITLSEDMENFLFGKQSYIIIQLLNVLQSIILFGALICSIINFGRMKWKQFLLQCAFVGGFIFYLFWEAKCQYTMIYFMLLIPIAAQGYIEIAQRMKKAFFSFKSFHRTHSKRGELKIKALVGKMTENRPAMIETGIIVGLLVLTGYFYCSPSQTANRMFHKSFDDTAYNEEVVSVYYKSKPLAEDLYEIIPYMYKDKAIGEGEKNEMISRDKEDGEKVFLSFARSYYELKVGSEEAIELKGCVFENGNNIITAVENGGYGQQWFLKEQSDGSFIISSFYDYVMTLDEKTGKVVIGQNQNLPSQKWWIRRVE